MTSQINSVDDLIALWVECYYDCKTCTEKTNCYLQAAKDIMADLQRYIDEKEKPRHSIDEMITAYKLCHMEKYADFTCYGCPYMKDCVANHEDENPLNRDVLKILNDARRN